MYVSQHTFRWFIAASLLCVAACAMEADSAPTVSRQLSNTPPLARPEFDRGEAPPTLTMDRMLLVLKRQPKQQAALNDFLAALQDKRSPNFHRWLTPEQFGEQYGPSAGEVQAVTSWLAAEGFKELRPSKGRISIEFSGTAQQVQSTFRTSIHKYLVKGEEHWANTSDPVIPAAFVNVIAGIASLNDFRAKPAFVLRPDRAVARVIRRAARPEVLMADESEALSPFDFDAIYQVMAQSWDGTGTTIAVVSDSNMDVQNVMNFWSFFSLNSHPPNVIVNGADPGQVYPIEPTLDVSWAGGIATGATIDLVVSQSTNATSGLDLSEQYIVDHNLADVLTESYGGCEADLGSAEMQFLNSTRQQAASQGMTFIVATGDVGSAGCDDLSEEVASGPLSVNGRASSPFDVAVGGTQFNEAICGSEGCWSVTESNSVTAYAYIPEDVWNQSCTAANCPGSVTPNIGAGSGGASTVFPKPFWQEAVPGMPNDGARDIPDVSFTSSADHDPYIVCLEPTDCSSTSQTYFHLIGGTSAATPSFAGIVAKLVENNGGRLGQINPTLYTLEAEDALSACNGSTTVLIASSCNFNDVTVGSNSVPGEAAYGSAAAVYQAGPGYDLATGLGSANAKNLMANWSKGSLRRTTITSAMSPAGNLTFGASVAITVKVAAVVGGGTPTGIVTLSAPLPLGYGRNFELSNGSFSTVLNSSEFPFGSYALTIAYLGDGTYGPSESAAINVSFANMVNGCTPTSFTTMPNPIITQSQWASAYIEANAPCGYDIRVGGPDGVLFGTGAGQTSSYAEGWVTNGMTFYMQQQGNTTPEGTMASLMITLQKLPSSCQVTEFSAGLPSMPIWDWFALTTVNVNANCAYDVREGTADGNLIDSGIGANSFPVEGITNETTLYLQPQGDTSPVDSLAIITAFTRQQGPVTPDCVGTGKRYCY